MKILERAKQLANGARVLSDWIGSGAEPVSIELAQSRANVCLTCPKLSEIKTMTGAVAEKIKDHMAIKNSLDMVVIGEPHLGQCEACGCEMKLKVWVPIARITPDPEEREKLDTNCWLLSETCES